MKQNIHTCMFKQKHSSYSLLYRDAMSQRTAVQWRHFGSTHTPTNVDTCMSLKKIVSNYPPSLYGKKGVTFALKDKFGLDWIDWILQYLPTIDMLHELSVVPLSSCRNQQWSMTTKWRRKSMHSRVKAILCISL